MQGGVTQFDLRVLRPPPLDIFQMFACGAAAVVAQANQYANVLPGLGLAGGQGFIQNIRHIRPLAAIPHAVLPIAEQPVAMVATPVK